MAKKRNSEQDYFMAQVKAYERALLLCKKHKRRDKTKNPPRWPVMAHRIDPRIVAKASKMGL